MSAPLRTEPPRGAPLSPGSSEPCSSCGERRRSPRRSWAYGARRMTATWYSRASLRRARRQALATRATSGSGRSSTPRIYLLAIAPAFHGRAGEARRPGQVRYREAPRQGQAPPGSKPDRSPTLRRKIEHPALPARPPPPSPSAALSPPSSANSLLRDPRAPPSPRLPRQGDSQLAA